MTSIPFHQVREYYERHKPDGLWFSPGALLFFKSKLPSVAYQTDAGILFITSETSPSGQTRFSVRRQLVSGDIKTVGEFHHYPTRVAAKAAIRQLDKGSL